MKSNMLRKIKLNALAGYMHFCISSILVFFISPLLVKFLGSSIFGVWKNIQAILSFATIADGRSSQALKWIIANDESFDDIQYKQQSVGSALRVWMYFLPFVTLIVISLVYSLPFLINGLEQSYHSIIYQAGFILGANLLISPLLKIPDAILVGTNKGYKSTFIQLFFVIVSNILMLWVSYLGYGLIGLSFVVLIVTLMNASFIFLICKRNVNWLGIQKPNKSQVREFFKFSFWVFIWSFVMKLILSTEIILIGYLISSEVVANYVFSTYVVQLAISFALLTGSAITPSLGNLIGAKEVEKSKNVVDTLRDIVSFIALFFASLIILINEDFIGLWMGESYYLGDNSNILVVSIMIFLVLTRVEGQVQDLSLNIKNKVISGFIISILSMVLGFVGYLYLNNRLEGLLLGVLIGRVIMNFVFVNMVNKMLGLKLNCMRYFYLIIFLIILHQVERFLPVASTWSVLIFKSVSVSAAILPLCFFLLLSKTTKHGIYSQFYTRFRL